MNSLGGNAGRTGSHLVNPTTGDQRCRGAVIPRLLLKASCPQVDGIGAHHEPERCEVRPNTSSIATRRPTP